MTYDRELLAAELRHDEGVRNKPYVDTTGHLTIGCGRNLDTIGLLDAEIALLLEHDIGAAEAALDHSWPWWRDLDPVRQRVMCNMCFNMGDTKLAGFVRFLAAVRAGSYEVAAHEMASSLWARQVGERAVRLEGMMIRGSGAAPGSPPTV